MARKTEILYINYYMSGSEAYQVESKPIIKNTGVKLPKQRKPKKIIVPVDPMSVLGILVAGVMFVLMIAGAVRLGNVQNQTQRMSEYVQTLRQENVQLRQTYEEGFDLEEIRQLALAKGMVPAEQAQQVQITLQLPQEEQPISPWENFLTFITGLFE